MANKSKLEKKLKDDKKSKKHFRRETKKHGKNRVLSDLKTKHSLLRKLVLTFSLVILCAMVVMTALNFVVVDKNTTADFKKSTDETLTQNKNYVELVNETVMQTAYQIMSNPEITNNVAISYQDENDRVKRYQQAKTVITSFLGTDKTLIGSIELYTATGVVSTEVDAYNAQKDLAVKVQKEDWYTKAMQDPSDGSWRIFDENGKKSLCYIRQAYNADNKTPMGVLKIHVADDIFDKSLKNMDIGKDSKIVIIDSNKKVISSTGSYAVGDEFKTDFISKISLGKSGDFYTDVSGKKHYIIYSALDSNGWTYIAMIPNSSILSSAFSIGKFSIIVLILTLIVCMLVSTIVSLQVSNPIKNFIEKTKNLASGDFSTDNNQKYSIKELNTLSDNFNNMTHSLKDVFVATANLAEESSSGAKELLDFTKQINEKSELVVANISDISDGSSKQASDTMNCAGISNDINEEISSAIELLNKVSTAKENTIEQINVSSQEIDELRKTSSDNAEAMEKVANTISNLNGSTKLILGILKDINAIANETNLLALNASIEAARAGEAGRGFSVVANQIKKLAEQSYNSSKEIESIIKEVNGKINQSMDISDNAMKIFEKEKEQVQYSIKSFNAVADSFNEVASTIEIALNSVKNVESTKDILTVAVESIASISEENTASTEEVAALIQQEARDISKVRELAERFNSQSTNLIEIMDKIKF
ncbi:methyl-accepting chemotaxis protein [Inconstantimicrobium mannanitabidum]|uniref:Methyl-accepting chemotaxis protein n=1 Tax=Inconstantimicrobium mannanitabidum TaxID=1604901 RepID=A0ACB5RFJ2_9CLOT|nr:methyl-accepting chemotaxis protein [Clostridium sp. TW13]GKX67824.1 methyl-accepting chemotaxis protein [Clostridium sp. TW13]